MDNKEMICSMVCCRQEATHHQHDVLAELPRLKTSEADVEGLGRNIFAAVILQPVIKFPVEPVEVEGVLDERHEACDWCQAELPGQHVAECWTWQDTGKQFMTASASKYCSLRGGGQRSQIVSVYPVLALFPVNSSAPSQENSAQHQVA